MNTLTTVRQLIDQLRNEARSIDLLNRVSQVTSDSLSTILVHSHLIDQQSTFYQRLIQMTYKSQQRKTFKQLDYLQNDAAMATAATKAVQAT